MTNEQPKKIIEEETEVEKLNESVTQFGNLLKREVDRLQEENVLSVLMQDLQSGITISLSSPQHKIDIKKLTLLSKETFNFVKDSRTQLKNLSYIG